MNASIFEAALVLGSVLGVIALVGSPFAIWGMRHARWQRELEHAERMRAMELGRPCPPTSAEANGYAAYAAYATYAPQATAEAAPLARKCYSVAIWTAFWGFVFASQARDQLGISIVIAAGATSVAVTSIICGTVLASRRHPAIGEPSAAAPAQFAAKPAFDPDAYDVAGRRG